MSESNKDNIINNSVINNNNNNQLTISELPPALEVVSVSTTAQSGSQQSDNTLNKSVKQNISKSLISHNKPNKKQKTKLSFVDSDDESDNDIINNNNTQSDNTSNVSSTSNAILSTADNANNISNTQQQDNITDLTATTDNNDNIDDIEAERERLKQQYLSEQQSKMNETFTLHYSYYNGISHRHRIDIQYKYTIEQILKRIQQYLVKHYNELNRIRNSISLMLIKNDIILPNNLCIYDLIHQHVPINNNNKELFTRLSDFSILQDFLPKVITTQYYDRHKHIYPIKNYIKYESLLK